MWIIIAIGITTREEIVRTVQMTLDDELVEEVDRVVEQLHSTRSAFTRRALRQALDRHAEALLEQQHRQGYERQPVAREEFSVWEEEQAWGDK